VSRLDALLERLYAPVWPGGWAVTRLVFGIVCFMSMAARAPALADAYASTDMVYSAWPFFLADHVRLTLHTAWILWGLGMIGAAGIAFGGRTLRLSLLLWVVPNWILLAEEALNIKAHDRLGLWIALALLLSPAGERDLGAKRRSPVARWFLVLVFCGIYGSTGWLKFLEEPSWWDGEVLAFHLVHHYFGGGAVAAWVSGQRWLVAPLGWTTVLFEMTFPLLVWWRRANPWVLLVGASFHLGVAALMRVGPFSWVALSAYPALLHPVAAEALWIRLGRPFARGSTLQASAPPTPVASTSP
jgi:hypothetical protein